MIKNTKGIISIFLALIIMPTYMFAIISIDIARLYAASNYLRLANEAAISSRFLNFDRNLYDKYGLLGIKKDEMIILETKEIVEKNLYPMSENDNLNNLKILDFRLDFDDDSNLLASNNLEEQIITQMSYKAPIKVINGFINLLDIMKTSKSYNQVLSKKIKYNEEIDKFTSKRDELSNALIKYSQNSKLINEKFFSYKKESKELKKKIITSNEESNALIVKKTKFSEDEKNNLSKFYKSILTEDFTLQLVNLHTFIKDNIIDEILSEKKNSFISQYSKIKMPFEKLISINQIEPIKYTFLANDKEYDIKIILNDIQNVLEQMLKVNEENLSKSTQMFLEKYVVVNDSITEQTGFVEKINEYLVTLNADNNALEKALNDWKSSIDKIEDKDVKTQFKSEYTFTSKKFSDENIQALKNQINRDKDKLILMREFVGDISPQELGVLLEDVNEYAIIDNYEVFDKIGQLNTLEKYALFKGLVTTDIKPAVTKTEKNEARKNINKIKAFNKENNTQSNIKSSLYDYIDKNRAELILKSRINELEKHTKLSAIEIDNHKDLGSILEDSNQNMKLSKNNDTLLNSILIAEYISDNFSNKFSNEQNVFTTQKEFILFGSDRLDANVAKTNALIFGTRMGLNSIYAFTNPTIRKEALMISTALAGWTGVGVPLMEALVVSMMSFGESLVDMSKLNENKSVEGFKNNATWQVSILGLQNMIKSQASELAKKSIDNIFDRLEDLSNKGVDTVSDTLDEFIAQSHDGIIQSINGTIIIPIQNSIMQIISSPIGDLSNQINELFIELNNLASSEENSFIRNIKIKAVNYLETNYINKIQELLTNPKEITNQYLIDFIEGLTEDVEELIKGQIKNYSNQFKADISSILSEKKENYKQIATDKINEYLGKFSQNESKKLSMFNQSALSFNYDDYLKLMLVFGLNGSGRNDILRRVALVIDYEMKKLDSSFDITNVYIEASITTTANVKMFLDVLPGVNRIKKIENTLEMKY